MKRTLLYLSAILLVAAAATGCSGAASSSQATASPAPAVTQSEASSQSTGKVELGRVIRPLPLSVDIANLGDCTVGAAVAPDGIFLDDSGKAQMTLTLYEYDLYDMADVSVLAPGFRHNPQKSRQIFSRSVFLFLANPLRKHYNGYNDVRHVGSGCPAEHQTPRLKNGI